MFSLQLNCEDEDLDTLFDEIKQRLPEDLKRKMYFLQSDQ